MPLGKGASASDWIHDFVHSDNPRFAGKSKKERINMALGAYYGRRADGGPIYRQDGGDAPPAIAQAPTTTDDTGVLQLMAGQAPEFDPANPTLPRVPTDVLRSQYSGIRYGFQDPSGYGQSIVSEVDPR